MAAAALMLSPGEPAIAANVTAARERVLTALQEEGYPLAGVSAPIALADDGAQAIDVQFRVETGPQADLGTIAFQGLDRVNGDFAREALPLHEGERYSPSRIETARRQLIETGVFSTVNVRAADQVSNDGRIALTVDVEER